MSTRPVRRAPALLPRRHFVKRLAVAAALSSAAVHPSLQAADRYPDKPVTLVTSFSVGSGPDTVLRLVADRLGKAWGQRVVVENRPGGAGFVAIDAFRRAAPDGYSLLQLDSEQLAALPHLYKSRNYDPDKVFDPVATLFITPFLVSVSANSPWKSVSDLLAAAKAKPGQVTYGSWGIGSPGHLGGIALESEGGVTMQHVPYKEVGQLYAAVSNREVDWSMATIASSQGPYQAGKLRYIAVAAPKRIPQMPEVPTVAESGGPASLDVNSFVVLLAPKGLPTAIRDKINADVAKIIADPEIRKRLDTFAFQTISWSPDEIRRQTAAKSRTYQGLIKKANVTLE
ncbi:MAG: tripartite tricarboxylate transporter substrate binding protein [Pigmentiphaga sp.]|uniref:Bug family tripartite tricarboxylate transporter substrate binding protein n=1 Tax=Pigmentiphaga sp. TaxID=1977564 RepID=UPI0029A76F1D|nr:tripartite tricarboxylate transporter substrate binding protein [Pigmentiphaga sp.]MDX3905021.1 tripartite tricarboxylate transporter substrate binding protein [Pigmentiphaga sp.]